MVRYQRHMSLVPYQRHMSLVPYQRHMSLDQTEILGLLDEKEIVGGSTRLSPLGVKVHFVWLVKGSNPPTNFNLSRKCNVTM